MAVKILIVSDSHGRNDNLRKAISNMGEHLNMMIHLGDSEMDPEEIEKLVSCPVVMVKGNCDGLSQLPKTKLIEIGSHKALLTHGHLYGGMCGLESMKEMAKENGANILMFGHTHEPIVEPYSEVVVLNPGSISKPRQIGHRPTYIVMTIQDDGRTDYVLVTM